MDYEVVLAQVLELLQREKRLSYRVLKRRLGVDDDELEDLKEDLIYAKKLAVDEEGRGLVWTTVSVAAVPWSAVSWWPGATCADTTSRSSACSVTTSVGAWTSRWMVTVPW